MKYFIKLNKNNIIIDYVKGNIPNSAKPYFTEIDLDNSYTIYPGHSTYINNTFTENKPTNTQYNKEKLTYKQEINSILKWFANNDWKINKIVIGEWSQEDERWVNYLKERAIKRKRYDELLLLLKD